MKQINFRKNEKITVGLILLLLCIFFSSTGSGPVTLDIYRNACGYPQSGNILLPSFSGQISLEEICLYGFGAESGSVCVSDLQVHF